MKIMRNNKDDKNAAQESGGDGSAAASPGAAEHRTAALVQVSLLCVSIYLSHFIRNPN